MITIFVVISRVIACFMNVVTIRTMNSITVYIASSTRGQQCGSQQMGKLLWCILYHNSLNDHFVHHGRTIDTFLVCPASASGLIRGTSHTCHSQIHSIGWIVKPIDAKLTGLR